jgi:hypothetical protein
MDTTIDMSSAPVARPTIIVKGTGYVPMVHPHRPHETDAVRRQRIEAALRYATTYLTQEPPDGAPDATREVFGPYKRGLTLDDARDAVRSFYGPRAAFHRVVLSPHASLEVDTVDDMIDWTRLTLGAVQDWLGHEWAWVGGIHANTQARHAHVIVAGRSMGESYDVTMTRGIFDRMRAAGVRTAHDVAARRMARYERIYQMGV